MRSDVARLVDGLLDRIAAHDRPADLVPLLARPLPLAVICDLLGVPRADGDRLDAWCDALRNLTAASDAEVTTAVAEMTGYLTELVTAKRRRPGEDVLSTLIAARDEGDRLSQDELVSFALVLLAGGYGTTADRLAGSAHLLLDDPERWGQLVRAPAMIPRAVEAVMAVNSSANHDETVFDTPDILDLARDHNPHLGFGHGVHHCLGAPIARVQLQEAVAALVRRFPGLRAAAPPQWKAGLKTGAPRSLPVAW